MDELLEQFYASNLDGSSVDEDQPLELEADNSMGNAFSGGLTAGTEGMGASIDYFQALLGTAVGADEFAERNVLEAERANATGRAALAGVEEFGEFLEEPTVGGAFTQIAKAGGQGLPSLLYSIGTLATGGVLGAAGGALARTGSKKAAKRLIDDATQKVLDGSANPRDLELAQAAYDLTKKAATRKGAKFGSYAGLAAGEYPSLAGENFSEALGAGQNRDLETALQSALVAVPQAAIGVGTEVAFLKLLGKSAASRSTGEGSVFGQLASNIGQKIGRGAGLEGVSEYAQSEIAIQNRRSYDPEYSQEEANLRRMESAFAGAVVGGFAGGVGGAVSTLYQNKGAAAEKAAPIFEKSRKLWEDSIERRQNDKIDEEEAQGAQAPQSEFAEGQVVTVMKGGSGPTSAAQANDGSILTEREITPEEVTIVKIKKADNGETIYQGKTKDGETKMWSDKELATGRWIVNPSREQTEALQKERADLLAKQLANKKTSGEIEAEDLAERTEATEERSDDLFAPENPQPERTPEEEAAWEADRTERAAAYRQKLEEAEVQRKAAQRNKRQAQAKKNFSADPEDGLLAAIVAAGGISRSSVERDGSQITEAFKTARVKGRSVFRKEGGLQLDDMVTALRELGYYNDAPQGRPDNFGANDLLDDLVNALADPETPYFTAVKGPTEQSLEDAYNEYYGNEQDDEPTQRSMETFTPTDAEGFSQKQLNLGGPTNRQPAPTPVSEPKSTRPQKPDLEPKREEFRASVGENLTALVAEDPDNARLVALEKQYREGDNARKDEILGVLYAEKQELQKTRPDARDEEATMEEVQDYFQGQGFQENVETIETKGYSRKKDPKKTFKNTEASRAQFEEAFGKKDWSDPFYAHMTESFLRRAAEAKMADVTAEGDPQSDFKIVATEKGYVLEKTSFIKDPDALDDQFVLKTLRGAKRSQFASGSGVELIEAGLEPKEINLVNLTDAGRELVRQRGNSTYQGDKLAEMARQGLPEFITEITELNVKLADEGKPTFDIRIQGKSIFDITSQDLLGPIGDVVAARADGADVQLRDVLGARGQMGDSRVETTVEQTTSGARVRNTVVTDRKSDNFVSVEFTDSFGEQYSVRRENNRPDGKLLTLETAKKEVARLERDGFKPELRLTPKNSAFIVTATRRVSRGDAVNAPTLRERDPQPSELGSNLAGAPQPASQARVEQIITAKQTQTTRAKAVDEALARDQFTEVENVKEYFYSAEEADAYATRLRDTEGFDNVTVKDPVVNEGTNRDTEQGLGDEVAGMSTANYNKDGFDAADPDLPKTRLNLEMNPRRDVDRSLGGKNRQTYGRQTYRGAEYPFGSLGTISTEFVTKTIAKIKPKKPVIVIGLSQLKKLTPAKIAEQFNDPQVAAMITNVAAELASNNDKRGEYIGFTNAHVALIDDISVANDLQTALISAHEALGHVLFNEEIEGTLANPALRKRLERDFEKARTAPDAPAQYQTEHGFEEWFADQTAITAKNIYIRDQKQPNGVVGRTFAKIAEKLKAMWDSLSAEFKRRFGKDSYSKSFDDYIENTIIKERAHLRQVAGKASREVAYSKKSLVRAMEESITKNPDAQQSVNSMLRNFKDHIDGTAAGHTMFKMVLPEDNILRGISPVIADMMYARSNAKSRANNQFGYLKSKDHVRGQVYDQLEKVLGTNWESKEIQDAFELAADQDKKTEALDGKAREIRDWLNKFYDDYIAKTPGNEIAKRDDYFPVALDLAAIFNNENRRMFVDATDTTHEYSEMSMQPEKGVGLLLKDGVDPNGFIDIQDLKTIKELTDEEIDSFLKRDFRTAKPFEEMTDVEKGVMTELLMRERLRLASPEITFTELVIKYNPLANEETIRQAVSGLVARQQSIVNDNEITFDAQNPQSVVEKARVLTQNIPHSELKPFIEKPEVALMKYIRHVITRTEWKRNTHDADGNDMLALELEKLPEAKRKEAVTTLERYLGYTDKPLNPRLSKAMSWMQLFNWVTLLPLATIGSIPEFGGALVNTKEFNGFGMAKNAILSRIQNPEQAIQLARTLGVTHSTVMGNLGLTEADAEYLDPRVRKYSDAFFSKIGLDYFTRYTREFASVMSVEFLVEHAYNKTNNDRASRYLKDHGVTAEQVKSWLVDQVDGAHYTFEGEAGKAVMGAMQRFVDNSMLKPNAAERTSWGNDPKYQLIWALKSYLFSFGKVILGGIKREMQMRLAEGDTTLAKLSSVGMMGLLTAAAFMPLAALSLELREIAKAGIAGVLPGVEANARYFRSDRMDMMTYMGELFDRGGLAGPMAIFGMIGKSAEWGESQGLGPIGQTAKALSPIFGPTYGFLVDDIALGLYSGKGWDVVPARIIPGYSLVL